jgi:hypothetical protein
MPIFGGPPSKRFAKDSGNPRGTAAAACHTGVAGFSLDLNLLAIPALPRYSLI